MTSRRGKPLDYCRLPDPEFPLDVAEQGEIVDVTEIGAASELARDEFVERVQDAVGPELRGEIADGQTSRTADREQVVTGEAHVAVFVIEHATAAGDDGLDQRHNVFLRDLPVEASRIA
jgi:hypothetical protein